MQPHIHLQSTQTRPVVIVVGDPARAKLLASMCEKSEELAYNREYRSFDCFHDGQYFTVTSHGVGSAGCAICFEELIQNGAKVIIRAGTAGSLQPDTIRQGDLVICHSAVREDGVSALMVPPGYPAVADPYVFQTMQAVASDNRLNAKYGMSLSSDLFYKSPVLPSTLETHAKANAEIVEMEIATLFVIAKIRKVRAGAVCCVDGSPFRWEAGDYDPTGTAATTGKKSMLELAIGSAVRLAAEKNW